MAVTSYNRRHHVMSPAAQDIASKALAQMAADQNADAVSPSVSQDSDLHTGRVAFASAVALGFKDVGFDLYSIATDDAFVPTIWKKDVVTDPVTGKKTEWLVAYTTDDDDIVRSTAAGMSAVQGDAIYNGTRVLDPKSRLHGTVQQDYRPGIDRRMLVLWDETGQSSFVADPTTIQILGSQKTSSMSPELHAVAEAPKKNTAPIAPGILTKNLTLDQSGQGGTAKVTVDFNDPQKGEDFFKQVEDLAGGVGGGEAKPAETPAEAEPAPEAPAAEATPPEVPAKPPMPIPAGAPAPMASTIKNMTHFGSKIVYLTMEKYAAFSPVYFYVNEDGQRVDVELPSQPKIGATILRPDTGEKIRIGGLNVVEATADDETILSNLLAVAVDIADKVPPMGWTNQESQNETGEGTNDPLPPNPALQQDAPPTADTANAQPPLYDSTSAPDAGQKQKFNMSVNPNDNSVTVKFEKPPALDAIDQAVQGQQPPMGGPQAPAPMPPPAAPAGQPAEPMTGTPKDDFSQTETPTQF